jgi:hypothetical protein
MQARCRVHYLGAFDLGLEGFVQQPKRGSGGGSSGSGKTYRGYWVDGQVAGRIVSALDGQSQGLADVVGRSEGAWLPC